MGFSRKRLCQHSWHPLNKACASGLPWQCKRHQYHIFNELSVVLVVSDLFTDDTLGLVHAGLGPRTATRQIARPCDLSYCARAPGLTSDADVALTLSLAPITLFR